MGADYPAAIWMPAFTGNYRPGRTAALKPSLVIIHCTDGHERAEDVGEMWSKRMDSPSSANFCVGQDATVIQAVALADTAWHAHAVNGVSVGVEHCARTPGEWGKADRGLPPSGPQYIASAQLVAWLCQKLGLTPSRSVILGHSEADKVTTHTRCPAGCGWDWSHYMSLVLTAYRGLAATV